MAKTHFKVGTELLGEGQYGLVYRGSIWKDGKEIDVAIKKVMYEATKFDQIKKEYDFLKQAQEHENIITTYGLEKDESIVYILLELCEMDLEKYLKTENPSLQQKTEIMHQSANALAFMHNLQPAIVHRDVKPGNILIKRNQQDVVTKITDFGFARIFDPDGSKRYMKSKVGTPMYLAPEQFDSRKGIKYTAAVDVFSLGLVYLVIMTCEDNPRLEPNPETLLQEDLLPYGQHLLVSRTHGKPMPVMFTLTAEDTWPVSHLKLIVNQMTAFDARHRIPMAAVHQQLSFILSANSSFTTLKRENEAQTNLLEIKSEEISNLSEERDNYSKETDALKLQLRKQDDQIQQKDQVIHESEAKAAQKDERIQMLESDVASKTMTLQSNASSFTKLKIENEDQTNLLVIKSEEIRNLSEERHNYSKKTEALKLQLRIKDDQIQQKDQVIHESEAKAAQKDERIQMLLSDVASKTSSVTTLKRENEDKTESLVMKSEEIATLSEELNHYAKETDALKLQLRTKDEEMLQKDHVIHESEAKAAQKDQKIQMLESEVDKKTKLLQSNTSELHVAGKKAIYSNKSVQTGEFVKSFRHTSVDLKLLLKPSSGKSRLFSQTGTSKTNIKCVNNFTIGIYCRRMCYVNNSIYCPHPDDNSIQVYSLEGECTKHIQFDTITSPRALHPLSEGRLVLAAGSSLFVVDYEGRVLCQIKEGEFQDVHISGHLMAVIETNSEKSDKSDTGADTHKSGSVDKVDRIHILSTKAPYSQSAVFSVGHTRAATVLLSEDASTVYVSDVVGHITTYSLSGQQISQAGGLGREQLGGLMWPLLCAKDSSGQVLICDMLNNRLQLVSAGGEWMVLLEESGRCCQGVQVMAPTDAFIQHNHLYVLHYFNEISVFKIV